MGRIYLKRCKICQMKFGSGASGNCPQCGSDNWRFMDQNEENIPMTTRDEKERIIEGIPLENGDVMIVCRRV